MTCKAGFHIKSCFLGGKTLSFKLPFPSNVLLLAGSFILAELINESVLDRLTTHTLCARLKPLNG